jgi:autotransporter translocation and assembly factor TamB
VEASQLKEIAGTVAATVTAEADTFAIDRVRASVVLDEASLTMAGVPFTQSSPTRLLLENGTARIENWRWNAQGNEMIVSGGATVTGPNPTVDLAVGGDVDLRILGAFASGFAPGGVARSDFTVKGLLSSPEIVGSIGITAGEIRIDNPPLAASDFNGIISISAGRIATVSLNGLVNGGSATLAGEVSVKDPGDPRAAPASRRGT